MRGCLCELDGQNRLAFPQRLPEDEPIECILSPHGSGRHHGLGPVTQADIPYRDRRTGRKGTQCHKDWLAFHLRLRLGKMHIQCPIEGHGRNGPRNKSCRKNSDSLGAMRLRFW